MKKPELLVKDVGEFVAMLEAGDSIDDLHLDGEVGDVVQRGDRAIGRHEYQHNLPALKSRALARPPADKQGEGRW